MVHRTVMVCASLATAIWSTPASAQGLTFGVKGGIISANIKVPDTSAAKPYLKRRTALAGGAFVTLGKGVIGLQLEAVYAQKGVKLDASSNPASQGGPITGVFRVSYVEVPALIRLSVPAGKFRPYVYAGPAAAFELKCDGELTNNGTTTAHTCDEATQMRRKLDLSAVGGGGLQVAVGGVSVLFEGRYVRGLQSLDKSQNGGDAKNNALSFLAGIAIGGPGHK